MLLFERFRGVKDNGSEIGWGGGREVYITFLCRGMVCGVDWIHLVGVGVGIRKPRGGIGYEKMHFCYYLSDSEGSRTKAKRLVGVVGGRTYQHFRVGGWCG